MKGTPQRRPLLRTSSPLKPKINRELTSELVQQTGALQDSRRRHAPPCTRRCSKRIHISSNAPLFLKWGSRNRDSLAIELGRSDN